MYILYYYTFFPVGRFFLLHCYRFDSNLILAHRKFLINVPYAIGHDVVVYIILLSDRNHFITNLKKMQKTSGGFLSPA